MGRMKYTNEIIQKIEEYCLDKPCAYETRPFGELPICYRVGGKIFAQFSPKKDWFKITLKKNPDAADFYRQAYPDVVVRGYHCPPVQQPYWNTIDLNRFDIEQLYKMIDEAYEEIVEKLTKKEQRRLPELAKVQFEKIDRANEDFERLCDELDANLDEIVGNTFDRSDYVAYNQLDDIHDIILAYLDGVAVAGGSYKFYDEETMELKRVFTEKKVRGMGLGKELLRRLEADARIQGYRYAILESGEPLVEAMVLYRKMGYKVIPNYGQYVDMPDSICMKKRL